MSKQYRQLSPGKPSLSPITIHNRVYSQEPGQGIDVDAADADLLAVNGWLRIGQSGPTSARPTATDTTATGLSNPASRQFFDTTLGTTIFFDGSGWRTADGQAA